MHDLFGRSRLPGDFTRTGRVLLVAEVFEALLALRMPSKEAALFVGAAGTAWLQQGGALGDLERDYLRIAAPRRSTMTPSRVWRQASTGRATSDAGVDTMCTAMENTEPRAALSEGVRELIREEVERQLSAAIADLAAELARQLAAPATTHPIGELS